RFGDRCQMTFATKSAQGCRVWAVREVRSYRQNTRRVAKVVANTVLGRCCRKVSSIPRTRNNRIIGVDFWIELALSTLILNQYCSEIPENSFSTTEKLLLTGVLSVLDGKNLLCTTTVAAIDRAVRAI